MARRQGLTRERVAEVGLRLLEEHGFHALSLERLAAELGVRAPSLYHHYDSKADVLRAIAERVVASIDVRSADGDWQGWMVGQAVAMYRWVRLHPQTALLLIEHMPEAATVAGFGRAARLLCRDGVPEEVQILLMEGAQKLTWGFTMEQAMSGATPDGRVACDPDRSPELARAREVNRWHDEDLLETSLRAFFAGVLAGPEPAAGASGAPRTSSAARPWSERGVEP